MTTFTGGGQQPQETQPSQEVSRPGQTEVVGTDGESHAAPAHPQANADKLRVKVKLTSVVFILNDDGTRLATLSLSAADVAVLLRGPTLRVAARIGDLSLVDDFSADVADPAFKQLLTIQGDELADFQYETYDAQEEQTYPGYDTLVYLRSGSLQFTFSELPIQRILQFFSQFAKMKALYDAATARAAQRASELQTRVNKMHYDILVRTPIIVFPRGLASKDVIVANLGEMSANNKFEETGGQVITKIDAGLRSIRLTSQMEHEGEMYSLQMLDDVNITTKVTLVQNADHSKVTGQPDTEVSYRFTC